ncbi:YebC/PmpR family DNA-binding regulatory protein [Hydrogenoanaerobacterium saccharovorans]|uniref:Probable transcriptional regulatory protein SAMN05216180_0382 n=1 Tax=Hydrogenoanaerobacterium saccharovorans TaxID=474960 RepID=A0A1H7Z3P6_9FIRM|nr:YebC/PmpR family DNA-binding transcriptional regulator [Hydrogenoanaerobacterium saccharovorans]RPF48881.1 YebC/PmpR family DNA-binding regulatory protein [Hydrogenoanaerobacterium saccharovorans]SEM52178.1 DNA-binding regulatory protein, YebC/PmpR family [Hydrogenoanaerobacterium saccharovorans]
MSGHSKWSTIKRKKEKTDGARAKIFTKIGREISVAVKESGADPNNNSKLYDLIAKAKANNVPNDNIDRAIKKASSEGNKNDYVDMVYEGYGPCGVAVIVEALTDNKNRTAGDLRHYFDKFGGNLGQTGCVSFMFERKGIVVVENNKLSEDKVMEDCMEVGANDFHFEEDAVEISCEPNDLHIVNKGLIEKGYKVLSADAVMVPSTYTTIDDPDLQNKMSLLLDHLEDNDDVQQVFHNWEMPDEPDED